MHALRWPVVLFDLDGTVLETVELIRASHEHAVREVLGNGSILGISVFGPDFEPWIIMILPPGGFLTLGFILLAFGWWRGRKAAEVPRVRRWPHGVASRRAA